MKIVPFWRQSPLHFTNARVRVARLVRNNGTPGDQRSQCHSKEIAPVSGNSGVTCAGKFGRGYSPGYPRLVPRSIFCVGCAD